MNDYICTNGHDLCGQSYAGPDCPYCEVKGPFQSWQQAFKDALLAYHGLTVKVPAWAVAEALTQNEQLLQEIQGIRYAYKDAIRRMAEDMEKEE